MTHPRTMRPCADCGIPTGSTQGLCRDCKKTDGPVPCLMCDALTSADDRHCKSCTRHMHEAATHVDKPTEGLVGGRWVRRGLLQVWQSDKPRPKTVEPCISHNTERGWQWHREHRIDWPLALDDPCGCRAAHYAHVAFTQAMNRRARAREAA